MSDPCEEALHELYHFLDGALTDDRRELISSHLDECTSCLGVFDFEVELRHVISQRCKDEVPHSLRLRIAEAIGHQHHGDQPA
jgi:mycothiol system anti-sigma-R factor